MADFESMMESDGFSDPEKWLDYIMSEADFEEQRISYPSKSYFRDTEIFIKQRAYFLRKCNGNNCSGHIVLKITKYPHKYFWSCSCYPECRKSDNFYQNQFLESTCKKCNSKLIIKFGINGAFVGCSNYPNCNFTDDLPFKDRISNNLYKIDHPKNTGTFE